MKTQPKLFWWIIILISVGFVGKGVEEGILHQSFDTANHKYGNGSFAIHGPVAIILGMLCIVAGLTGLTVAAIRLWQSKGTAQGDSKDGLDQLDQ